MRLRRIAGSARTLSLLAAAALLTALVIGGAFAIGRSSDSSGRAATDADEEPSLPRTTSNLPQAALTREVRGWPHTRQNPAGEYSWDGRTCAGQWCVHGFMHNGYASGDVDISIRVVSERPDPNDARQRSTSLSMTRSIDGSAPERRSGSSKSRGRRSPSASKRSQARVMQTWPRPTRSSNRCVHDHRTRSSASGWSSRSRRTIGTLASEHSESALLAWDHTA